MMAYQQEHISPDIVTMAKGLAAGYQPIGALLCTNKIIEVIRDNSGYFQHGHTFMGHATAVAASLATQKIIRSEGLLPNVVARGKTIRDGLRNTLGEHPNVGDIRGRGLFFGLEFVRDRKTKAPFPPQLGFHKLFKKAAFNAGLICYPMGGTVDGQQGDHVLLAPPFIIDIGHIDEIITKLDKALKSTLRSL